MTLSKHTQKYFLLLCTALSVLFVSSVFAEPKAFTCTPLPASAVENKIAMLNTKSSNNTSVIYFIKNTTNQTIWLNHSDNKKDPHANAGWASSLQSHHWAALSISKKDFALDCSLIEPGKVVALDCARVIQICETDLKMKKTSAANYWLVEDKPWINFIKGVLTKLGKK